MISSVLTYPVVTPVTMLAIRVRDIQHTLALADRDRLGDDMPQRALGSVDGDLLPVDRDVDPARDGDRQLTDATHCVTSRSSCSCESSVCSTITDCSAITRRRRGLRRPRRAWRPAGRSATPTTSRESP